MNWLRVINTAARGRPIPRYRGRCFALFKWGGKIASGELLQDFRVLAHLEPFALFQNRRFFPESICIFPQGPFCVHSASSPSGPEHTHPRRPFLMSLPRCTLPKSRVNQAQQGGEMPRRHSDRRSHFPDTRRKNGDVHKVASKERRFSRSVEQHSTKTATCKRYETVLSILTVFWAPVAGQNISRLFLSWLLRCHGGNWVLTANEWLQGWNGIDWTVVSFHITVRFRCSLVQTNRAKEETGSGVKIPL